MILSESLWRFHPLLHTKIVLSHFMDPFQDKDGKTGKRQTCLSTLCDSSVKG